MDVTLPTLIPSFMINVTKNPFATEASTPARMSVRVDGRARFTYPY